jgi:hypothetical protein
MKFRSERKAVVLLGFVACLLGPVGSQSLPAPQRMAPSPQSSSKELVSGLIVVEQGAGTVSLLDMRTGEKDWETPVNFNPHEIAVSTDGRTAFVTNFGI